MLRIAVVDDQQLFRDAFRSLVAGEPDLELVGEAGSADEAYRVVDSVQPDLVLLNAELTGTGGADTTQELLRRGPRCKVMLLAIRDREAQAAEALQTGAHAYALREHSAATLFDAMRV